MHPENVLLGAEGPRWWWHHGGVAVGHPGRVMMITMNLVDQRLAWWYVCNAHGARNTLAQAIRMYDPFQRSYA